MGSSVLRSRYLCGRIAGEISGGDCLGCDDGSIDSRTREREREGGRDKKKLVEDQKADGAAKRER